MAEKNTSELNIYDNVQGYGFTSQDYFVHMLRFQKLSEICKNKNVLEIGCGKHTNLLKACCMMHHGPQFKHYIGTDYGNIVPWRQDNKLINEITTLIPFRDFTSGEDFEFVMSNVKQAWGDEQFIVICFEVLEHMDFDSQILFINNLSRLINEFNIEDCYFSTPNFNGHAANNHISELSCDLLAEMFMRAGIKIKRKTGLSAWKKYWTTKRVHETDIVSDKPLEYSEDLEDLEDLENTLRYLEDCLPVPLMKMIWGALLCPEYSNNILWLLNAEPSKEAKRIIKDSLVHINERQGVQNDYSA
jgi:hypothetical protein